MNPNDKLQLIRALEEQEASHRRRGNWFAWGSVLLAALIMSVMILAGRRELRGIEQEVSQKQVELDVTERKLALAEANLARVKTQTDSALRTLQTIDGRPPSARELESAVDDVLEANSAATASSIVSGPNAAPSQNASGRAQRVKELFDPNPSVRVKAYGGLLPLYKDDPTLIPELLRVAEANPQNDNGIYNTLVVLSHMNADSLRPHSREIRAFAEASKSAGPRVAERANTLLRRLPQ